MHTPFPAVQFEGEQQEAADCPGTEGCLNCCPMGRKRDERGCLVCDCLRSGLVQGDIMVSESGYEEFFRKYGVTKQTAKREHSRQKRGAFLKEFRHWPKKGKNRNVVIPYTFDSMCESSNDVSPKSRKITQTD